MKGIDPQTLESILRWIYPRYGDSRGDLLSKLPIKQLFRVLRAADRLEMAGLTTGVCAAISRETFNQANYSNTSPLSQSLKEISRLPQHLHDQCASMLVRGIAENPVPARIAPGIKAEPLQQYLRDDPELLFFLCLRMAERMADRIASRRQRR